MAKSNGSKTVGKRVKFNDTLTNLVNGMDRWAVDSLFSVFAHETQEFKLDRERKQFLRDELQLKDVDLNGWQDAADIIKHFDLYELNKKHPEEAKKVLMAVLSIFPPAAIVAGICDSISDELVQKILGFSLIASPDHLVNMLVTHRANVIAARNAAFAEGDQVEEGKRNLAIVTKDELLFQQIKKLVETDDDESEEVVVGTKDGTVRIIRWEESKWVYRNKTDAVDTKVIVIGDCKKTEGAQLMDARFDQYGIRYGWIGNVAYIHADLRKIRGKGVYDEFLKELGAMRAPEIIKEDKKLRLNWKTGLKTALATPLMAKDLYDDTYAVKRQMYFFGLIYFYYHDLEAFLNS